MTTKRDDLIAVVDMLRIAVAELPAVWDAREAILEMKDADYPHWRQMEWIGWYFQYQCERVFDHLLDPGLRYDKVEFDAFGLISWDYKSHAAHDRGGRTRNTVITNDQAAIDRAISDTGWYGLILATGVVEYNDEDRTFQNWHDELKGGLSPYQIRKRKEGARSSVRKTGFVMSDVSFICLNKESLIACARPWSQGKNSNDRPRAPKYNVNIKKVPESALLAVVRWPEQGQTGLDQGLISSDI